MSISRPQQHVRVPKEVASPAPGSTCCLMCPLCCASRAGSLIAQDDTYALPYYGPFPGNSSLRAPKVRTRGIIICCADSLALTCAVKHLQTHGRWHAHYKLMETWCAHGMPVIGAASHLSSGANNGCCRCMRRWRMARPRWSLVLGAPTTPPPTTATAHPCTALAQSSLGCPSPPQSSASTHLRRPPCATTSLRASWWAVLYLVLHQQCAALLWCQEGAGTQWCCPLESSLWW